jgi:hypothetical protein
LLLEGEKIIIPMVLAKTLTKNVLTNIGEKRRKHWPLAPFLYSGWKMSRDITFGQNQGDQIGRIFAYWSIIYFGLYFETYRCNANFWTTFFYGTSYVLILTNIVWATFWATFSQTHLVTLVKFQWMYLNVRNRAKRRFLLFLCMLKKISLCTYLLSLKNVKKLLQLVHLFCHSSSSDETWISYIENAVQYILYSSHQCFSQIFSVTSFGNHQRSNFLP